jgi:hypothetical protein
MDTNAPEERDAAELDNVMKKTLILEGNISSSSLACFFARGLNISREETPSLLIFKFVACSFELHFIACQKGSLNTWALIFELALY